ncbi:MAG: hypothetical protein HUJ26_05480 [Planctomycetaceae bacterium]|nr:hypothetical protein [Planctomycetaceae bacterium]
MIQQRHHLTALLLLAVWPMTLGLATGWHVHVHPGDCVGDDCHSPVAQHAHLHGHHGHGHSHAHHHAAPPTSSEENHSSPTPHDSEDCPSCQILALTGTTYVPVSIESSGELLECLEVSPQTLFSLDAPTCFHLRGPPGGIAL